MGRSLVVALIVFDAGCFRLGLDDEGALDAGFDTSRPDGNPAHDANSSDAGADDALDSRSTDGSDHDDAASDGDTDGSPPVCDLAEPFGTPWNVTEINLPNVNSEDPTLTFDLLEIVFSSTRPGGVGGVDLWTTTRADTSQPWNDPELVAGVNSPDDATTPEISGDGTLLIFASSRPGGDGLYDLYRSTRPTRTAAWSDPTRIAELASPENEFTGTVSVDRLSLVFSSSRAGGLGGGDIYIATRSTVEAPWSTPSPLMSLNSSDDDSAPWMSTDGLTIFFSSTRPGGAGEQDVWRATRATHTTPWSTPEPVSELNGVDYDSDPWLSPDCRTIVYSRLEGSFRNVFMAVR
jgi:Tol biopolymer transport system component